MRNEIENDLGSKVNDMYNNIYVRVNSILYFMQVL